MAVDEERITFVASEYCTAEGADASSAGFFLGALPLRAIELLCEVSPDDPLVQHVFGHLYPGIGVRLSFYNLPTQEALLASPNGSGRASSVSIPGDRPEGSGSVETA
jgi:hypothetical protein